MSEKVSTSERMATPAADASVLVVADQARQRHKLRGLLEPHGLQVGEARRGVQALMNLRERHFDAVLLDDPLPDMDSFDVLRQAAGMDCNLPIILLETAARQKDHIDALKAGAYSIYHQGGDEDLVLTVLRAIYERHPELPMRELKNSLEGRYPLQQVMGWSPQIAELAREVERVAPTSFSVLLIGETGTGKEVVAQAIHRLSPRRAAKLVAIDCGAIPETLIENELFGHERGAFTGAATPSQGKFQLAADGTLLLDEIGNLPMGMQGSLLRALEQRRFYRVGGHQPFRLEARLIAATNLELDEASRDRGFRDDLYHRLAEYVIRVPPLAARKEDITFLARRFLNLTNRELKKAVRGFTLAAHEALIGHDWPGNVRELRNVIRRAVLLAGEIIDVHHLQLPVAVFRAEEGVLKKGDHRERGDNHFSEKGANHFLKKKGAPHFSAGSSSAEQGAPHCSEKEKGTPHFSAPQPRALPLGKCSLKEMVAQTTCEVEQAALREALTRTGGNKAAAARLLQIDYKTIHSKLRRYDIKVTGGATN